MNTPDLTPDHREVLDWALRVLDSGLTDEDRSLLTALRDACPEPRWLPTEDGRAECVDSQGDRTTYYVRDGKVSIRLRSDGTLLNGQDPADFSGTWEPYVHEVTPEQIVAAAQAIDAARSAWAIVLAALPALGCREVGQEGPHN